MTGRPTPPRFLVYELTVGPTPPRPVAVRTTVVRRGTLAIGLLPLWAVTKWLPRASWPAGVRPRPDKVRVTAWRAVP